MTDTLTPESSEAAVISLLSYLHVLYVIVHLPIIPSLIHTCKHLIVTRLIINLLDVMSRFLSTQNKQQLMFCSAYRS